MRDPVCCGPGAALQAPLCAASACLPPHALPLPPSGKSSGIPVVLQALGL